MESWRERAGAGWDMAIFLLLLPRAGRAGARLTGQRWQRRATVDFQVREEPLQGVLRTSRYGTSHCRGSRAVPGAGPATKGGPAHFQVRDELLQGSRALPGAGQAIAGGPAHFQTRDIFQGRCSSVWA